MSLPPYTVGAGILGNWGPGPDGGWGSKGHSTGGNAKPTFGTLNVIPGRDLFSS